MSYEDEYGTGGTSDDSGYDPFSDSATTDTSYDQYGGSGTTDDTGYDLSGSDDPWTGDEATTDYDPSQDEPSEAPTASNEDLVGWLGMDVAAARADGEELVGGAFVSCIPQEAAAVAAILGAPRACGAVIAAIIGEVPTAGADTPLTIAAIAACVGTLVAAFGIGYSLANCWEEHGEHEKAQQLRSKLDYAKGVVDDLQQKAGV